MIRLVLIVSQSIPQRFTPPGICWRIEDIGRYRHASRVNVENVFGRTVQWPAGVLVEHGVGIASHDE